MLLPSLLSEISSHDLEVAETLIGILRFVLIFVGARTLSEILVRLELPTILGELLAGVIIGASGSTCWCLLKRRFSSAVRFLM